MIETLLNYVRENWPEMVWIVVAMFGASYLTARRARRSWADREFLHRLNVSLSSLDDGWLRIRTLLEMDCEEVFLNPSASRTVVAAARNTTDANPNLPLGKDDYWFYLNAVLNEISERFAAGQLKRDLGQPVETGRYLLCLTCERAGPVRTRKIRGLLVQRDLLTNLPEDEPKYESPTHSTRWQTLRILADRLGKHPHEFIEIEICL